MRKPFIYFIICVSFFLSLLSKAAHTDPQLTIQSRAQKKVYLSSELLERADLETLVVTNDPSYPEQVRTYKAIPVSKLFQGIQIEEDAVIQFKALDGFSAPLSKKRLLNTSPKEAIAYIAIEPSENPWPKLKPGKSSAGPFYLVWKNPELSSIGTEEWPFMLSGFEIKGSLESVYPGVFPSFRLKSSHPVNLGFQQFLKNCFACHTLNKQGAAQFGPDLNIPMNPTEYFSETTLKKLIRNPQDVRYWPQSRMKGFSKELLSDEELDQLIAYLKHMAAQKK